MRALIVGEGRHDVGLPHPETGGSNEGALGWAHGMFKHLLGPGETLEADNVSFKRIPSLPKPTRKYQPLPKGSGHAALKAKIYADLHADDFDVFIFVTDADTDEAAGWREKCREVEEGLSKVDSDLPHVIAVPKSTSESWLLADAAAWAGAGLDDAGRKLPSQPEECLGKPSDPQSGHPKMVFERLSEEARLLNGSGTENRQEIAALSDPLVIARKCPLSFRAFWAGLHAVGMAAAPPEDPMRRRR